MNNAERILHVLERALDSPVELTLYGRAALQLGFDAPPEDYARSKDIDAVFWLGQAEELAESTNFWEAVEQTNRELSNDGLYISHFFEENQVVLSSDWKTQRVRIQGPWRRLSVSRLGDADLLLSKLMRDDPLDQMDAQFIYARSGLTREQVVQAIATARVPEIVEIQEQFAISSRKLLEAIPAGH